MNVFAQGRVKAVVSLIEKRGRKPREIRSFDLPSRAAQRLVHLVTKPRARTLPTQFLLSGGPANAIAFIKDAIEAGYEFVQQLDVTNCYGSYDEGRIATLIDVPHKVAQASLVASSVQDTFSTSASTPSQAMLRARGQPGISAGSLASPLVSENLLAIAISEAKMAADFPSDVHVVSWADNLVVLSRSQRDLERARDTLRSSFSDSLVGSLKLREVGPSGRRKSFDFIGYRLTRRRYGVMVSVTPANRRRLIVELNHQVRKGKIGMYDAGKKLSSWASSMFLWTSAKQWASMTHTLYRSREKGRTILSLQANFATML